MGRKRSLKRARRATGPPARAETDALSATIRARPASKHSALRSLSILFIILSFGFILRLVYLAEIKRAPDFALPLVDAGYHDYWARSAASRQWRPPRFEPDPQISTTPYFRPPGYPFFLAAVYAALGDDYTTPRMAQFLLGLVGVVIIYLLGRRIFGESTGLVAAALAAVEWIFIYFEGELLEPSLSVVLILALVLALLRYRDRAVAGRALAAGLALGALSLVRPNALLLSAVTALWFRRRRGRARWVRDTAVMAAGVGLFILPVAIRNYRVSGDFVPISSNGGINLLIGNGERADGEVRGTLPGIGSLDTSFDWPDIVLRLEQLEGRRMSHADASDFLARRALMAIRNDPARIAGLLLRKTALYWGPDEVADNRVIALDRSHSRVLRRMPLTFPVALALGLLGFVVSLGGRRPGRSALAAAVDIEKRRDAVLLIASVVLVWFLSHLPFAITSRYRVPVIPFLLVFAAAFLVWLVAQLRARRFVRFAAAVGAAALLLAMTRMDVTGYEPSGARWHYQRAIALQRGGNMNAAVREMRAALEMNPRYVAVYIDLGAALARQGKIPEALPCFQKALELNPDNEPARENLAIAMECLEQREE